VMEKDGSGNSTGKDADLDALLSAADRGMLDAIRDHLDLDTGFAQILAGIPPTGRPTGPAEAEPGDHAHSYGHALDPVRACEVSGAAHKSPAPAGPETRREPRHHHRALTTLALAVITALNIALLYSLSHNHGAIGAQSGASATTPTPKPIVGEPARDLWYFPPPRPHQLIVLASKAGASASLRFAADSAGIGGDPAISYLRDSRSGPVFLLSGFPVGTAIRFLSTGADQPCGNCSTVSHRNHPFPSGGEQLSTGTTICITGDNGQVMLKTVQNQPSGQIGVMITWFPDLM
jgi:hypothetical protein